jgi:maleate cis-trans isomerase
MINRKRRVGFIIPSVNVVFEDDVRRFMPATIGAHIARWRTQKSHEESKAALKDLPRISAELCEASLDMIAFACTAGSVVGGTEASHRIIGAIESACGLSAITTGSALSEAFAALNMKKIIFLGPFDSNYTRPEVEGLESFGITVVRSATLGLNGAEECAALTRDQLIDWACSVDNSSADGLFLSCANVRGFEVVDAIERKIGKPVVSSNQAVFWSTLKRIAPESKIAGGGSLFNPETPLSI